MPVKKKSMSDQADAIETDPAPAPSPSPTPRAPVRTDFGDGVAGQLQYDKARKAWLESNKGQSPAPKGTDLGSGMVRGQERNTDSLGRGSFRETVESSTPAADAQRVRAKFQDKTAYPDEKILEMAEAGNVTASVEARRRGLKK